MPSSLFRTGCTATLLQYRLYSRYNTNCIPVTGRTVFPLQDGPYSRYRTDHIPVTGRTIFPLQDGPYSRYRMDRFGNDIRIEKVISSYHI